MTLLQSLRRTLARHRYKTKLYLLRSRPRYLCSQLGHIRILKVEFTGRVVRNTRSTPGFVEEELTQWGTMMKECTANYSIPEKLTHFKDRSTQCLQNAYEVEHTKRQASSLGGLTTSLVEDVFTLLYTECSILSDLLTAEGLRDTRSGAVIYADGVKHVLRTLQETHSRCRLLFLTTLVDCCAAANDFLRMSDSMEKFASSFSFPCMPDETLNELQQVTNDLVTTFSQDAVFAAERTQLYMMREVNDTSIGTDFFTSAWEDEWTNNEITLQLMDIFDEYMRRIQQWLGNDYLFHKALVIAAKAMICFYIRCIINKADSVTRRRRNRERFHLPGETLPFNNHQRALRRIADDIGIMKEAFVDKTGSNATSRRIISDDIYILELICECLGATDLDSVESFIVVIHKHTGADALVTRYFVGDLWMLMLHRHARSFIRQTLLALKDDLQMVSKEMLEREPRKEEELSFVCLDIMLKIMYEDRLAQGVLPACWTCLPKVETEGDDIVVKQIRSITRKMAELKWTKKPPMFRR